MKANLKRRDYHEYVWKKGECFLAFLQSALVVLLLVLCFYRSFWAVIPLSAVGVIYFHMLKKQKSEKCRQELVAQFKECMLSVSTSLRAGYAVENAFLESRSDMKMLYGEQSLIYQELELIRRGLVINITLEELLTDLAERSDCDEISQFAQVFSIAKRSGGNMSEIIYSSTELIGQRIDARQEIQTMLGGRRMEQNIMKCMPFAILFYIGITYRGYFDSLYHNWQGAVIMTGCLLLYLVAFVLGNKIMQGIEKELAG